MYEGAHYQELYQSQNSNIATWLEIFTSFKFESLLESALDKSDNRCIASYDINQIFD